jgi:hypothetical protein
MLVHIDNKQFMFKEQIMKGSVIFLFSQNTTFKMQLTFCSEYLNYIQKNWKTA